MEEQGKIIPYKSIEDRVSCDWEMRESRIKDLNLTPEETIEKYKDMAKHYHRENYINKHLVERWEIQYGRLCELFKKLRNKK